MRWTRRILIALVLALLGGATAGAGAGATPLSGSAADPSAWFEASGLSVVRSHAGEDLPHLSAKQLERLELGPPVEAYTFTNDPGKFNPSNLWVAPVLLEGKPVATVATEFRSGESQREKVTSESRFATALTELTEGSLIVVEPKFGGRDNLGGWFLVSSEGSVTALDPVARSVLAGEVTIASFQEIRADLLASDKDPVATPDPVEAAGSVPGGMVRIVVIVLAVLLFAVGLLVWLRHEREEPERGHRQDRANRSRSLTNDVKILERPRSRRERNKTVSDTDLLG